MSLTFSSILRHRVRYANRKCVSCYSSASNAQSDSRRRVVVTGCGVVSPVGCSVDIAWTNILKGFCGIRKLTDDVYGALPCRIAAKIAEDDLKLEDHFTKSELRALAPATAYALIAAQEAIEMAQLKVDSDEAAERVGVAVGMGMVDLDYVCETFTAFQTKGYNRVSPHFVPRILTNIAAGQISIKYGLRGPNHAVSTACATGAHAIGDSMRMIRNGDADVMVCGGTEACISPLSIAGFCRLRALCTTHNDEPEKASRPFDQNRNGFVMGEGAGIIVLETLEHARNRGATILAEICGYGMSGDAVHITSPHPEGRGALLAMKSALRDARVSVDAVGYVNAHATSTPIGDNIEAVAIGRLFGETSQHLSVSSTKGAHGHLLGAAGNLEAIFTILACRDGVLPPTLNLDTIPEHMSSINFVANAPQRWESRSNKRIALKNAFGFGGTNASLCIAEFRDE